MKSCRRKLDRSCMILLAAAFASAPAAFATVGPPVEIKMPADTKAAVSGQPYEGVFEIRLSRPGSLGEIKIEGPGWTVISVNLPNGLDNAGVGTVRIPFTAVPADADQPIGFSLTFDGRRVSERYEIGPRYFASLKHRNPSVRVPGSTGLRGVGTTAGAGECSCLDSPLDLIRGVGRNVYTRPDGKVVGADRVRVEFRDQDVGDDYDLMWEGFTDADGYFNTGCLDADVDGDGSNPDLVLYYETDNGWVDVTDNSLLENTYWSATDEISQYPFDCHDFGEVIPVDARMHTALHISNVITRARRYLDQLGGFAPGGVQVEWPVEEWTHYQVGPEEIHLKDIHQWEEMVIIHEYGHHFMHYFGDPPGTDYCNTFCDTDPPDDCGHCAWCPENDHDAFNEGFPNWMSDVITRAFAETYEFSPGVPYAPFIQDWSIETEFPRYCEDEMFGDALETEGFVGLLLRDIEDETQDDHDGDGIFDLMCLGPLPIFQTFVNHTPTTALQFINAFRTRYPDETDDLWATAFNVGGPDYVFGFPADTQPPGVVPEMDSPSHPLGAGGELPCLSFEFAPAPDDVTGCNNYSYSITRDPQGAMPGEGFYSAHPTDDCKLRGAYPLFNIGEWHVSVRAQDNAGRWSDEYTTFGPFEVLDCNGTGQLDVCDISCNFTGLLGRCDYGISPCINLPNCVETSQDCNGNLRPDECDIASGFSADCNLDGVPDECQDMKHWSSHEGNTNWAQTLNWMEGETPQTGEHVCIQSGDPVQVSYQIQSSTTNLASLASYLDLTISGTSPPWPAMVLNEPSFVRGEFFLSAGYLTVNDSLDLDGLFRLNGSTLQGSGQTNVRSGITLSTFGTSLSSHDLLIKSGPATSQGGAINLSGGALVVIDPDVTYQYNGNFNIFTGGASDLVHNAGTILRASGDGNANIGAALTNVGTVRAQTGELSLGYSSSHTGQVIGDEGTIVTFYGVGIGSGHHLLPDSTLDVHALKFTLGEGHFHGSVNIADSIVSNGGTYYFEPEADIVSYGRHVLVTGTPTGISGQLHFLAPTDPLFEFESVTTGQGGGNTNIHFDTGQPVNIENLHFMAGGIHGGSPINVNGTFTWNGGSFQVGGDVTTYGPVVLQGTGSRALTNRTLHNTQTATIYGGGLDMSASGRWNNLPGAQLNIQANSASISGGTFTNAANLIRISGTGIATISSSITNTGLIHNQTGTLSLSGFNLNPPSTHSGTVRSDAGAILRLGGGTHIFQPSSNLAAETLELTLGSGTVEGAVEISQSISCNGCNWTFAGNADILDYGQNVSITPGGILRFEAPTDRAVEFDTVTVGPSVSGGNTFDAHTGQPFNINTLVMNNNSQLFGNSPINVAEQFTWQGGNMFAGGAVTLYGNTNVLFTSSNRSASRHMHNHGTMALLGAFSLSGSSSLTNHPDGVIDFQSNSAGISGRPIHNHGLFVKSAGDGQANVNFTTWTNTGTIDIQTGSIGMHTTEYVQTDGETILNGGDLRVVFGSFPITINGGVIKGVNSVFGNLMNNGGTTAPGLSIGELTIAGNYTQGPAATLDIEIGGDNPGEFDVLTVTGTATLAGELRVTDIENFAPSGGDAFIILTAAQVNGTFGTEIVPAHYHVVYNPTNVTIQSALPSPDLNGDGRIDLLDFYLFQTCFQGATLPPAAACAETINADLNLDGQVDLVDFQMFYLAAFGE